MVVLGPVHTPELAMAPSSSRCPDARPEERTVAKATEATKNKADGRLEEVPIGKREIFPASASFLLEIVVTIPSSSFLKTEKISTLPLLTPEREQAP